MLREALGVLAARAAAAAFAPLFALLGAARAAANPFLLLPRAARLFGFFLLGLLLLLLLPRGRLLDAVVVRLLEVQLALLERLGRLRRGLLFRRERLLLFLLLVVAGGRGPARRAPLFPCIVLLTIPSEPLLSRC